MLYAEYLRLEPQAAPYPADGALRVWRSATETTAHRFESLFVIDPMGRAFEVLARDGMDTSLVSAILRAIAAMPAGLPDSHLWVGQHLAHDRFETTVVVPPSIAQRFEGRSASLSAATYWVFPAYTCEFRTGHDSRAFQFAIRSNHVAVLNWSREPAPIIRAQLLSKWPGGMVRFTRQPYYLPYSSLAYVLPALPSDCSGIRLLSSWGSHVTAKRESDDSFVVSVAPYAGPRDQRKVRLSQVVATVQSIFLSEGRGGGA